MVPAVVQRGTGVQAVQLGASCSTAGYKGTGCTVDVPAVLPRKGCVVGCQCSTAGYRLYSRVPAVVQEGTGYTAGCQL